MARGENNFTSCRIRSINYRIIIERSVLDEIEQLLIKKKAGTELDVGLKIDVLNQFLEEQIHYYQQYVKGIEKGSGIDIESLNTLFRDMLFAVYEKEHK